MTIIETFQPGDKVKLLEGAPEVPKALIGQEGVVRKVSPGRGKHFGKWYAIVEFETTSKLYRIPAVYLTKVEVEP